MNPIASFWGGSRTEQHPNSTATATEFQTDSLAQNDGQATINDATRPKSSDSTQIVCPDPSAHYVSQDPKLAASSATAGLYQTSDIHGNYPLDKDGKLSSAGTTQQRDSSISTHISSLMVPNRCRCLLETCSSFRSPKLPCGGYRPTIRSRSSREPWVRESKIVRALETRSLITCRQGSVIGT